MFYDEDEGTKVIVWNTPEGEVTTYSIRISYYDTFLRQQYFRSENSWIQLHLADLPSQRPLWIEVLGVLNFTNEWIKCRHVCLPCQVRARNSAGSGPWSSRVELCMDEEG